MDAKQKNKHCPLKLIAPKVHSIVQSPLGVDASKALEEETNELQMELNFCPESLDLRVGLENLRLCQ
jgi:hypothetical protein